MVSVAGSCGPHAPYQTRAEARWRMSWHLTCFKCRLGKVMNYWHCDRCRSWHIGHRWP